MLILITAEQSIEMEADILKTICDTESCTIHVRKPHLTKDGLRSWIEQFDTSVRKKMVLHQHHDLAMEYSTGGIHFKEAERTVLGEALDDQIHSYCDQGLSVSSSFHATASLEESNGFDYVLLSPVFDSISKNNYKGKGFDVSGIRQKVVGLGGVSVKNLSQLKKDGFSGAAVMGAVWKSDHPADAFSQIKEAYDNAF
ncbi:thiamine phosphate synthase [Marinoscillum sp. MHG1-6]|uniref:thiamine phosphate synthase n=1 Tax=Marinoscillum sp. MHG1-6 TaxID=2959627 RepID=UPI00215802CC|nr:thiamine phosphate synthase [Marinoscillum sp. MHG1-6]